MIQFRGTSGAPDPQGQYVAALAISMLYANDRTSATALALALGGKLDEWVRDQATVPADFLVINGPGWSIVAVCGTTNNPQALNYIAGYPASVNARGITPASALPVQTNWGFQDGLDGVQVQIAAAVGDRFGKRILIAGHSYGAACGFILGRRWASPDRPLCDIQLLTFGEPRSFTAVPPAREVDWHARLVSHIESNLTDSNQPHPGIWDPVTLLPPTGGLVSLLVPPVLWRAQAVGLTWEHFGDPYTLTYDTITPGTPAQVFGEFAVAFQVADAARNMIYFPVHYMRNVYLPASKALWEEAGEPGPLAPFASFVAAYNAAFDVLPDDLGPVTPNDVINESTFAGEPSAGPVTPATRLQATLISASVYTVPSYQFGFIGSSIMTLYKGTFDMNAPGWGGFSESVYSDVPTESAQSMMQKMIALLPFRMKLSVGPDNPGCNNPIVPYAIRVEDELVLRDTTQIYVTSPGGAAVANSVACPGSWTSIPGASSSPLTSTSTTPGYNQNLDCQLGARVKFTSGTGGQIATPMFHGFPVGGMANTILAPGNGNVFNRQSPPSGLWLQQLQNYVQALAVRGLGFRNIGGAWGGANNQNVPFSGPSDWTYDPSAEMVTLLWLPGQCPVGFAYNAPTPPSPLPTVPPYLSTTTFASQVLGNWPFQNSRCRLQVRGWKSFPVLNGRWSAQAVAPWLTATAPNDYSPRVGPYAFALQIKRKVRQPQDVTVPLVNPIVWSIWWPGENLGPNPGQPFLTLPPYSGTGTPFPTPADFYTAVGQYQYIESKKLGRLWGSERGRQRNRAS
jgi:hypothetical protein